jgi:hypothetical protein
MAKIQTRSGMGGGRYGSSEVEGSRMKERLASWTVLR